MVKLQEWDWTIIAIQNYIAFSLLLGDKGNLQVSITKMNSFNVQFSKK